MERYKKKTIALCLASLLTVVGAFGAENYNNTLMDIKVNVGSGGFVSITTFTEKPYNEIVKAKKIDDNTFVITLKDTNNNASAPNINKYDNIESIQISTYPYTPEAEGCTRIVVKTNGEPALSASNALYIPDNIITSSKGEYDSSEEDYEDSPSEDYDTTTEEQSENDTTYTPEDNTGAENSESTPDTFTPSDYTSQSSGNSSEYMTVILCISILLVLIGFIFMLSRDKMASVVGDQGNLDVEEDKKNKKQSKTKKLKSTINKLDKTYSNKKTSSDFSYNTQTTEYTTVTEENTHTAEEDEPQNVVDLDLLYQETQKAPALNTEEVDNDNDDLADLLNSFMSESEPEEIPEEEPFDEEFYNKIINSTKLNFTESDIKKLNALLQVEISSETIDNLKKYMSKPIKAAPTKDQILADLISTYSINQSISFTNDDVKTIQKLMNVEIGEDFTKDFTTNPERTKIVEKKIRENTGHKAPKTSEILTLSVKDMLPDLSQELKKQGGKAIKSEAKPTVVYFSEGYEYQKLEVSDDFQTIKADSKQNEYKPSYDAPVVASGYEYSTLSIKDELPDLADVKANPKKYDNTPKKQSADESALLKSLANVTFKPFYEDSVNTMSFEEFENDEPENNSIVTEPVLTVPVKTTTRNDDNAQKLLKLIETQQNERALKKQSDSDAFKKELEASVAKRKKQPEKQTPEPCRFNGEDAELIKTVKCSENTTCKIIHTKEAYYITGNMGEKVFLLKEYKTLKDCSLFVRPHKKDNKEKYLVKVGTHKFIIKVTNDKMEFMMDLC